MFSYRYKILADRTIGFILSVFVAIVARIVGFFLQRNHGPAKHPKSIAVAKFMGIGSIVYVGYFCRLLKIKFPEAKLYFITTKTCASIAGRLPDVDEVLTINDSGLISMFLTNVLLIVRLWHKRPELYFDMEVYSSYSATIANLSLARNRYGFYRKSVAFKKGLFTHFVFFNTRRHISEIYHQMALAASVYEEIRYIPSPVIYPEDEARLSYFLEKLKINNQTIILLNPNASELLIERRWMVDRWAAYLQEATMRWRQFFFLIVGAPYEKAYVDQITGMLSEAVKEKAINVAGQLDFGAFLALIKMADLIVTVDSACVHLAAALGKPTISLWGPVDPEHYAPISGRNKILYNPVYCSPCLHHADSPPCGGNNQCMKNISVQELLKTTDDFMKETFR